MRKYCKECALGNFIEGGDGRCSTCWGSGISESKRFATGFTKEIMNEDYSKEEIACDTCSATGQCQRCGGEGWVYVDDDDDHDDDHDYSSDNNTYTSRSYQNKDGSLTIYHFIIGLTFLSIIMLLVFKNCSSTKIRDVPNKHINLNTQGFIKEESIAWDDLEYENNIGYMTKGSKVNIIGKIEGFYIIRILGRQERAFIEIDKISLSEIRTFHGEIYQEYYYSELDIRPTLTEIQNSFDELKLFLDNYEVIIYRRPSTTGLEFLHLLVD